MYGFSFNIMNKKRTIKSTLNVTCLEARVERVILSMMTYILLFSMILKCRQKGGSGLLFYLIIIIVLTMHVHLYSIRYNKIKWNNRGRYTCT